jgi:hypothetical protein
VGSPGVPGGQVHLPGAVVPPCCFSSRGKWSPRRSCRIAPNLDHPKREQVVSRSVDGEHTALEGFPPFEPCHKIACLRVLLDPNPWGVKKEGVPWTPTGSTPSTKCPFIDFATPLPHPFPEPLDTGFVPRQVSTASLRHLPAQPLQAASGHPGGAGGDGQGGSSWRASVVAWAVGWFGGRASYPCSRKRGGETGVRRVGAGLLGKATGEVMRGRRQREKGVGGPRRRGHSGLFLSLRAPGRFPLAQWRAVRLGWGPQRGLTDPAAPGVSASARRNRRGKLSLWA